MLNAAQQLSVASQESSYTPGSSAFVYGDQGVVLFFVNCVTPLILKLNTSVLPLVL